MIKKDNGPLRDFNGAGSALEEAASPIGTDATNLPGDSHDDDNDEDAAVAVVIATIRQHIGRQ